MKEICCDRLFAGTWDLARAVLKHAISWLVRAKGYIYIFLYFGPTGTLLVSKLSLVKFCCTLIHSDASCVIIFVLDLPS